jgi:hypothetical protein
MAGKVMPDEEVIGWIEVGTDESADSAVAG